MKTRNNFILVGVALILVAFSCGRGEKGDKGDPGIPGLDGAQITLIQFCPNSTPTYPSIFPESAFCISNQVYAILDQGNGYDYLTIITPGAYTSQGVGSVCNFIVKENCEIVN